MVSQEQKCIWIISQVRLPPLSLSLALLVGVGPGEAPSLSLSLTLLVGVGEGLLSICRLTLLPRACPLMAQLRLLEWGWWRFWNPECLS